MALSHLASEFPIRCQQCPECGKLRAVAAGERDRCDMPTMAFTDHSDPHVFSRSLPTKGLARLDPGSITVCRSKCDSSRSPNPGMVGVALHSKMNATKIVVVKIGPKVYCRQRCGGAYFFRGRRDQSPASIYHGVAIVTA
jgi:hypothetical protein